MMQHIKRDKAAALQANPLNGEGCQATTKSYFATHMVSSSLVLILSLMSQMKLRNLEYVKGEDTPVMSFCSQAHTTSGVKNSNKS